MIDYKYSFACTEMDNNFYSLVMTCWYINDLGNRVDVKISTLFDKTLTECLELVQQFIIPENN
jgi:hypothetical protein